MGKFKSELKSLKWQNFIGLTIAGIVNSIGVTLFLAPINLYDGGLSGTSLLLNKLLPLLPLSFYLIVINLPFFIIGFRKQGAAFTIYSLYAVAIYSIVSYLIQHVLPIANIGSTSPIAGNDFLLCAIFGGLISGLGSGLTIRFGGAIDGVEVMAVIFSRRIGLSIGTFVMLYNLIIFIAAALFFHSWAIPLYSIIAYAVGLKAVDFVVEGLDKAKAAFIVTSHADSVGKALSESLGRGITMLDARGYYSKESKTAMYCVVNRFQIAKVKKLVSDIDPSAFVTITDISDTLGNGLKFRLFRKKPLVPKIQSLPPAVNNDENSENSDKTTKLD